MNLKDKVVIVTGSSQGIGKATSIAFAKEGANVVVTYNSNKKKGEEVFKECSKFKEAFLIKLNVTDEKSIKDCVEKAVDKFGAIDILVNNAGILIWKNLSEQNDREIESQINTNLIGLIKMTKAVLPYMKGQSEGIIINIASTAGKRAAHEGYPTYCASKFGVRGFTRALALELPSGIKIFAVNPGLTATAMTDFEGIPAKDVAEVIVNTAKEKYSAQSGGDVDVLVHKPIKTILNKFFGY